MKTRKNIKKQPPKISSYERAGQKTRKAIIILLTILMTPFYFVYGIFFKIPTNYSPLLGFFRGAVTFAILCWLTKDQGMAFERNSSEYLSTYMDISLAKLLVASIELICVIEFFISILIIGGFHMSMEISHEDYVKNNRDGQGPYPNIDHALKDFDGRLGYGTIHGMLSQSKSMMK